MTAIAPPSTDVPVTRSDYVMGVVISGGFRMKSDGWLYPRGGEPLVRVCVAGRQYIMERRRSPEAAWMRIVVAGVNEFDQAAFESWADNWPLTA